MSTVPPTPPTPTSPLPPSLPPSSGGPTRSSEIKLISHSTLFYWWPVWALAFLMAFVTWVEGHRLAIVPSGAKVTKSETGNSYTFDFESGVTPTHALQNAAGITADNAAKSQKYPTFKPRMSEKSWPGAIFVVCLILTIIVTNVPLRGLWSFMVIIMVVVLALLLALLDAWDKIFEMLGNLHIHINMAGYMTIGVLTFIIWVMATYIFDRRSYVIFTPGQVKVCEHIGSSVQAYSTMGLSMEKQRDDLFRHYIYGLGSGDLILKVGGSEKREVRLPNVLFIGWRLKKVEDMIRSVVTT